MFRDPKHFEDSKQPEILRSHLDSLILTLKSMNIDPLNFDFIGTFSTYYNIRDAPNRDALNVSFTTLQLIGALDQSNKLSKDGSIMAKMPFEPRISKVILTSTKPNLLCSEDASMVL